MISLQLYLSTVAISIIIILVIIRAVRAEWIQLKYCVLWLCIGTGCLIFALFPQLLLLLSKLLGVGIPANALFFMALVLVLLLIFQLTTILSQTEEQQRRLAQKVAILELELEQLQKPQGKD